MTPFTGWQYLCIDVANQFGKDKELFETRIQWTLDNLPQLESLTAQATESKPMYAKAVMALRKAQKGIPTGHLVGLDASCSGIQIMSVLTGCTAGATATGLVNPNERADAYGAVTRTMNELLQSIGLQVNIARAQAKDATMTSFYGSSAVPKTIFGTDTPELEAFYTAAATVAPGAWDLLQTLNAAWQSNALAHCWTLPDGFEARVKVMDKVVNDRIQVDELDKASFSYTYKVNKALPKGHLNAKSLPANVTHSMDAYVLRTLHRRCNYDRDLAQEAHSELTATLVERDLHGLTGPTPLDLKNVDKALARYAQRWEATRMADVVILPHVVQHGAGSLSTAHIQALLGILDGMLAYQPFEMVTIHDEFRCHPNRMNHLRQQYINILAEIAESTILDDILTALHGRPMHYRKINPNLGQLIRGSNYGLC